LEIGSTKLAAHYAFAVLFFTSMAILMVTGVSTAISDVSQLLLARGLDTMTGCGVGLAILLARRWIDPDQALRRFANNTDRAVAHDEKPP
jgi:ABC-type transport system involved in multi-copper enzyme maturation permease subunit